MTNIVSKIRLAKRSLLQWIREELVQAPLEPILHASFKRIWWLGLSIFLGNAMFAWIWSIWLPQPYENLVLRALACLMGLVLMIKRISSHPDSLLTQRVFSCVFWLVLPVFFSWMYLRNSGSPAWLAAMSAMVLIYYLVTDWRLATFGTISGCLVSWTIYMQMDHGKAPDVENQTLIHAVAFAFSWLSALILNLSSANQRRTQLLHTLTTIGIMAHELRTPLSTAALLGDAIQMEVKRQPDNASAPQLAKLALRLHTLVRSMNHQIDTQIANAKLKKLPSYTEWVSAKNLIVDVVNNYPYAAFRQRACVRVVIHDDFSFRSSSRQFSQVLDNLMKNAFHSLMAADSRYPLGALRIEVSISKLGGRILVQDEGMGIEAELLPHIFKPFFSSNKGTGHGLGLAFCKQVVQSAGGSIDVKSEFAVGATFTISLPIAT